MSLLIGQTEHKYITTISRPYNGFAVVIPHPKNMGEQVRKHFFGVSRSQDKYLQDALAWRDQTYFLLYGCGLPQRIFYRQQVNSNTSVPGVRRIEKVIKKKLRNGTVAEYRVECILAEIFTIPNAGYAKARGSKSKLYSINKYGEDEATRLAIEWRQCMMKERSQKPSATPLL